MFWPPRPDTSALLMLACVHRKLIQTRCVGTRNTLKERQTEVHSCKLRKAFTQSNGCRSKSPWNLFSPVIRKAHLVCWRRASHSNVCEMYGVGACGSGACCICFLQRSTMCQTVTAHRTNSHPMHSFLIGDMIRVYGSLVCIAARNQHGTG
jgi:hypothetical protein